MPSTLRAMCLASALLFVAGCGGELPSIAPTVPTAIPLPTRIRPPLAARTQTPRRSRPHRRRSRCQSANHRPAPPRTRRAATLSAAHAIPSRDRAARRSDERAGRAQLPATVPLLWRQRFQTGQSLLARRAQSPAARATGPPGLQPAAPGRVVRQKNTRSARRSGYRPGTRRAEPLNGAAMGPTAAMFDQRRAVLHQASLRTGPGHVEHRRACRMRPERSRRPSPPRRARCALPPAAHRPHARWHRRSGCCGR